LSEATTAPYRKTMPSFVKEASMSQPGSLTAEPAGHFSPGAHPPRGPNVRADMPGSQADAGPVPEEREPLTLITAVFAEVGRRIDAGEPLDELAEALNLIFAEKLTLEAGETRVPITAQDLRDSYNMLNQASRSSAPTSRRTSPAQPVRGR
jgi:hypothetical protein